MAQQHFQGRSVYIVDGTRSPYLKAGGKPGPFLASDLAVAAGRQLLARLPINATDIGETIFGCMMPTPDETNIGRIIGYRLGCGKQVPGWTVQRNCASGLQAIDSGLKDIAMGRHDLVLAGGTDAMSHAPLLYNATAVNWFAGMMKAKTASQRVRQLARLPISAFLKPVISLMRGLTDPMVCLLMGQTAENLAYRFNITREEMDIFAVRSHQRLAHAIDEGVFQHEVISLYDHKGKVHEFDTGLRRDSSIDKLATLRPFFDKKYGMVTAANSSQVTDGAAMLLLASADAVKKYNLPVLGRILDINWAGLEPEYMGLGPVYAATPMLERNGLNKDDIDFWEINEAFAAQVIACLRAWQDEQFCQQELGLSSAFGALDESKLNIDGGAVALGHPVGSSGARILLHLANVLRRKQARLGVASICIGGGLGGAALIEQLDQVVEA